MNETPPTRRRYREIENPEKIFSSWHFSVIRAHWLVFSIQRVERVDKEQTKVRRTKLKAAGVTDKKIILGAKVLRMMWVHPVEPAYDFHDGDLFHASSGEAIQVVNTDGAIIEAHHHVKNLRHAYHLSASELAEWLRTGIVPAHRRVDRSLSRSETLRYGLAP